MNDFFFFRISAALVPGALLPEGEEGGHARQDPVCQPLSGLHRAGLRDALHAGDHHPAVYTLPGGGCLPREQDPRLRRAFQRGQEDLQAGRPALRPRQICQCHPGCSHLLVSVAGGLGLLCQVLVSG